MKLPNASEPSGHEATSVVQCELIQHISLIGKFKMLGCGMAFNSGCAASVIWLSHKNQNEETDWYLANTSAEAYFSKNLHLGLRHDLSPPVISHYLLKYMEIVERSDTWR